MSDSKPILIKLKEGSLEKIKKFYGLSELSSDQNSEFKQLFITNAFSGLCYIGSMVGLFYDIVTPDKLPVVDEMYLGLLAALLRSFNVVTLSELKEFIHNNSIDNNLQNKKSR